MKHERPTAEAGTEQQSQEAEEQFAAFLATERCPHCGGSCDIRWDWGGQQMVLGPQDFAYVEHRCFLICAHPRCPRNSQPIRELAFLYPRGWYVSRFWPTGGSHFRGPRPTGADPAKLGG
uniref:Uncharacterized protein n=1 Tax=viral metagenome TaxID=1070528 RepID=A0A6M3K9T8_9ZZZZ